MKIAAFAILLVAVFGGLANQSAHAQTDSAAIISATQRSIIAEHIQACLPKNSELLNQQVTLDVTVDAQGSLVAPRSMALMRSA